MQRYEISVSEPWNSEGPDGPNRIVADGLGIVTAPDEPNWRGPYLLLQVVSPFEYHGEQVQCLTAAPRYKGDTIEMLVSVG